MTSIDDKAMLDEIIATNGGEDTTHIIEYQNQFDGRLAWKLCNGEGNYIYAMAAGAFIDPKLIWRKKQNGLGDF